MNYTLTYDNLSRSKGNNSNSYNIPPSNIEIKNNQNQTVAIVNPEQSSIYPTGTTMNHSNITVEYDDEKDEYYAEHEFSYPAKKVRFNIDTENSEWPTDDPNEMTITIPSNPQTDTNNTWNNTTKTLTLTNLDQNNTLVTNNENNVNYATELNINLSQYNPSTPRPTNECSLSIDTDVVKYIQQNVATTSGKLEIPTNNSVINQLINYEIDDPNLDYANSISIDLSNLPTELSPNIEINSNGTYNLGDYDNNKMDLEIEKDQQQQRSLLKLKRSEELTRDEFNTSYTIGSFNVNVQPVLQNKTINYELPYSPPTIITADSGYDGLQSVTFNCSSEVLSTMEYPDRILTSSDVTNGYINIQNNYRLYMTRVTTNEEFSADNLYVFFDGNQDTTWAITPTHQLTIEFDVPKIINGYKINGGNTTTSRNNLKELYGSNDGIVWTKLLSNNDNQTFHYNNQTIPYKYYGFRATNSNGYNVVIYEFRFLFCNTYPNYQSPIVLENNKELLIDSSNNQTTIYLNPSIGYDGFTNAIITTNVTPNLYNGYTAENPLILDNNGTGTITIPENYTGLGAVHYNVAVSDQQLRLEQNYEAIFDGAVGQSVVLTPSAGYNGFENVRVTILRPSDKKEIYQIRFGSNHYTISNGTFTRYTTSFTMQPGNVVISLRKGNGFISFTVFYAIQQTIYDTEDSYYCIIQNLGSSVSSFWLQDYTNNDIIGGFLASNNDTKNCYLFLDDSEYTLRDFNFN